VELAILVGLPAAGKSSFVRERLASTHVHVSRDLLKAEKNPLRRQTELVREALLAGRSVAVDNTHPRRVDRAPLIALARTHGATVAGYVFGGTPGECLARNRGRAPDAGRVPAVAVWTAFKRMEAPAPDEGFDRLYDVTLVSPAGFVVQERVG